MQERIAGLVSRVGAVVRGAGTDADALYALVLVVVALLAAVIAVAALAGFAAGRLSMRARLRDARKDAVKRSRAVLGGQAAEQVAPFLPGFPCNPADARFVGKPVDFVAFPGAADGSPIREVLLIEVKTGGSQLSAREKEIQRAVESGQVRYVVYKADGVR